MLILGSTTDKLQVVTSAAATVDVYAGYADMDDTTKAVLVDRQLTAISTATTTDVVAAPASGASRRVGNLKVENKHASVTTDVTVLYNANGTTYQIEKVTLGPGERLGYQEGVGFRAFDNQSREKLQTAPVGAQNSIIAQIASHSADTYYLGMDITNRIKAGSFFRWIVKGVSKTAGTANPAFAVRTGTAGTTGDTARATVTLGAQTAVVDQGNFEVIATFRAVGASAILRADVTLHHNLLSTGFATTPAGYATGGNTGATFDSTPANTKIGLSVNPGASGAWVVESCVLDTGNLLA